MSRSQHRQRRRGLRLIGALTVVVLLATACGGAPAGDAGGSAAGGDGGGQGGGDLPTATFLAASSVPVAVAIDRGFYVDEGLNVEFQEVGEEQATSLFIGGDAELGSSSPWAVARFVSQGEEITSLSTAGATNFINGVLIRAEDKDKYTEISDLQGKTLGIPGFGSGTWQAFAVMMEILYGIDDARQAFQTKTASPGALLGLLGTGEIEAALLFSGQTVVGTASDQFERIFSFTRAWQERKGEPMTVDMYMVKDAWAQENPELVQAFIRGTNRSAKWMQEHPDAFTADGQYAELARGAGWLVSPEANERILQLLADGQLILTAEEYDQKWIDAMYSFIQQSKGVLIEGEIPPADKIFYPTDACC